MQHKIVKKMFLCLLVILCFGLLASCSADVDVEHAMLQKQDRTSFVNSVRTFNDNTVRHRATTFNGVSTIKQIDTNKTKKLDVSLKVISGDFQLVLIKDKTKILLLDAGYEGSLDLSAYPAGEYALKMAGEKANFDLEIVFS